MLKNPYNSIRFYFYSHDCILALLNLSVEGWLATLRSLRCLPPQRIRRGGQSLFQHICLQYANNITRSMEIR